MSAAGSALSASSLPGSMAANASLVGAKITYGPLSSTGTMLTAGFMPPDSAALKVLMSGMLARTLPAGRSARLFQSGLAFLKLSQPEPCGSGISTTGAVVVVGAGSA